MENTFRVPWFHRNPMSEFMGLIHGVYDAKPEGFRRGGCSIHNKYIPHGPDGDSVRHGQESCPVTPARYSNTMAFMWETQKVWKPTRFALDKCKDHDYVNCWNTVPKTFDPNNKPPAEEAYPFDGGYKFK